MPAEAALSPWLEVLGRLHPLVLHFPIALLITAALLELLGGARRSPVFVRANLLCLAGGALGAALAAASGWYLAEFRSVSSAQQSALLWHRWGGVFVAGGSLLALGAGLLARNRTEGAALVSYRALLLAIGVATGLVAHLGGQLTWGEDWLGEPLGRAVQSLGAESEQTPDPALSAPPQAAPAPEPAAELTDLFLGAPEAVGGSSPAEASARALPAGAGAHLAAAAIPAGIDFAGEVLPLLSARCVECHGPNKVKGDLRLDALERILHAEPEYWVVIPGRPEESLLLERVRLPDGDPDRMPPKGERLTAAEVELLERWIAGLPTAPADPLGAQRGVPAGASGSAASAVQLLGASASALDAEDVSGSPVVVSAAATGAPGPGGAAALPPAEPELLELWRQRGARALELAEGDGALELSLARCGPAFERAWLADLPALAGQLVWLDLSGLPIEDGDLAHLAALERLEHLRLDGSRVGNGGLAHLAALPRLARLNLCSTAIDDAGLARFETGFPALRSLYLWNSAVGAQAAAALAAARPALNLGPVAEPEPPQAAPESAAPAGG